MFVIPPFSDVRKSIFVVILDHLSDVSIPFPTTICHLEWPLSIRLTKWWTASPLSWIKAQWPSCGRTSFAKRIRVYVDWASIAQNDNFWTCWTDFIRNSTVQNISTSLHRHWDTSVQCMSRRWSGKCSDGGCSWIPGISVERHRRLWRVKCRESVPFVVVDGCLQLLGRREAMHHAFIGVQIFQVSVEAKCCIVSSYKKKLHVDRPRR